MFFRTRDPKPAVPRQDPMPAPERERRPVARQADSLHKVGETTGMFRARTAEAIRVEVEKEIDIDQLPESLRKLLRQGRAG
jgi:hypothetical protein